MVSTLHNTMCKKWPLAHLKSKGHEQANTAVHTRHLIYLLLEQNADQEKLPRGLEDLATQVTYKSA